MKSKEPHGEENWNSFYPVLVLVLELETFGAFHTSVCAMVEVGCTVLQFKQLFYLGILMYEIE